MSQPNFYIIAGANGAGKTSSSRGILNEISGKIPYINADEIALGLNPDDPSLAAIEAGRITLDRLDEMIGNGKDLLLKQHWLRRA